MSVFTELKWWLRSDRTIEDAVLALLVRGDNHAEWWEMSPFDIESALGMDSANLYVALMRLERSGILMSRWKNEDASAPRLRLYSLNFAADEAAT